MAIQTGRPLGCVIAGAGLASTVVSFGDAASASELGGMVADAYVQAPVIEEASKAPQAPAVFSAEIADRLSKLRGEAMPQQLSPEMSDGKVSASEVRAKGASGGDETQESLARSLEKIKHEDQRSLMRELTLTLLGAGWKPKAVKQLVDVTARAVAAMSEAGWEEALQLKVVASIVMPAGVLSDFEEMIVEMDGIVKLAEGFHRGNVSPDWQSIFVNSLVFENDGEIPGYGQLGEILRDMLANGWDGARVSETMGMLVDLKPATMSIGAYEWIYEMQKRFIGCTGLEDFVKYIVGWAGASADPEGLLADAIEPLKRAPKQMNLANVQAFLGEWCTSRASLVELLQEAIRREKWRLKVQR